MEALRLQRLSEASEWLLRLESPGCTEEDINQWLLWCDADPENVCAFETVQRDWHDLDALKIRPPTKSAKHAAGMEGDRLRARVKPIAALAAGLATIAVAVFAVRYERPAPASSPQQVAADVVSRSATLPDGSRVILGVQTRVNVDFTGAKRQLDLSTGEAYFKVQHDKQRPFVVQAGEVSVTAVGTAFDVRRHDDKVTVTVEEGVVEVASRSADTKERSAVWRAEAGYQLTYSTRDRVASIAGVDPSTALMWRNGELAYVREPLASVIEDLNRYSSRKIRIEDPAIAELRFTGTAFASGVDDWLKAVQQVYPVTATETSEGVVLSARSRSP